MLQKYPEKGPEDVFPVTGYLVSQTNEVVQCQKLKIELHSQTVLKKIGFFLTVFEAGLVSM